MRTGHTAHCAGVCTGALINGTSKEPCDSRACWAAWPEAEVAVRTHGSRQELAVGSSKEVMGSGTLSAWRADEEGRFGAGCVSVNNSDLHHFIFFLSFNLSWLHRDIA